MLIKDKVVRLSTPRIGTLLSMRSSSARDFDSLFILFLSIFLICMRQFLPNSSLTPLEYYLLLFSFVVFSVSSREFFFSCSLCPEEISSKKRMVVLHPRCRCQIITGLPSSIHGWKNKFFSWLLTTPEASARSGLHPTFPQIKMKQSQKKIGSSHCTTSG